MRKIPIRQAAYSYWCLVNAALIIWPTMTAKSPKLDPVRALLKARVDEIGTTLAAVSRKIGKNHAYLQQFVERGTPRNLPEYTREDVARVLDLDEEKLRPAKVTGGAKAKVHGDANISRQDTNLPVGKGGPMASVEELDVAVSAGDGITVEEAPVVRTWSVPKDLVSIATDAPIERIKIVRVKGDSMSPTYNPIDRLMVDTDDVSPSPGGVFIVWDGLGLVVKRVQLVPHSEPPRVKITSDNIKYDPYERVLGEAYIQGRVIGKWMWA
jgi:phage repressor protein C with HTH and peptisase S24 domain